MFKSTCKYCAFFQLFDTASLQHMKTFKTERPVNSAALSPLQEHVSRLYIICVKGFR